MHTVKPPPYLTPMSAAEKIDEHLRAILSHLDALEAWVSALSPALLPDGKKMVLLARLEAARVRLVDARALPPSSPQSSSDCLPTLPSVK
jgi:hypothetical protein